jgi:hypothetical protein
MFPGYIHPRNMVCCRYIIVNTLYKSNNKINNNDNDTVIPLLNYAQHHASRWRNGVQLPPCILSCALDGGQWSVSCPGSFTPVRESSQSTALEVDGPLKIVRSSLERRSISRL